MCGVYRLKRVWWLLYLPPSEAVHISFNLRAFVLCYLYCETVAGLRVAVLLAEENKTKWWPTIGYFVFLELRVALSLADDNQSSLYSNQ